MNTNDWRIIPNTELIAALRKKAKQFHRVPRTGDFSKGSPNMTVLYRAFGSWSNALRMAGLK